MGGTSNQIPDTLEVMVTQFISGPTEETGLQRPCYLGLVSHPSINSGEPIIVRIFPSYGEFGSGFVFELEGLTFCLRDVYPEKPPQLGKTYQAALVIEEDKEPLPPYARVP